MVTGIERLTDTIDPVVRLRGLCTGVTLEDIRQDLSVSRRTVEIGSKLHRMWTCQPSSDERLPEF